MVTSGSRRASSVSIAPWRATGCGAVLLVEVVAAAAAASARLQHHHRLKVRYLVDPASSHMLVSKIKPCMSKYKRSYTVKLRMAH